MDKGRFAGSAALLGSAFLWATGYIAVKQLVNDISPGFLLALRFTMATVILLVLLAPKLKKINRGMLGAGIRMGLALFFEFYFFTTGVQHTTASKSSFIIASYIILLPIAYIIIRRKRPQKSEVLAALMCMAGLCLIMADNLNGFNIGDLLSCFCAVAYAVHVVYAAKYAKEYDGSLLNLIQIGTSAVMAWIFSFVMGDVQTGFADIPFWAIVYLAVICTIIPYFLCLFGMKYVSTTTSGILLSFESVFATILAVIMLNESLYWQLIAGGAIIISSCLVSELLPARLKKKE